MPTNLQLKLIHVAYRQAGLNEPQYRMLLKNVAGVDSAKKLLQRDFENVMAVLEDCGFRDTHHGETYWRDKIALAGSLCGARLVHKLKELAPQQRYELPGLCLRFSQGRTDQVTKLRPREAWQMVDMLKAVIAREGKATADAEPGEPQKV